MATSKIQYALGLLIASIFIASPMVAQTGPFIAYSMQGAERQLKKAWHTSSEVRDLGGITKVAGMVYDEENRDLIVVGQVIEGEPKANLDYLVVAIRVRLLTDQWPSVSIDKTMETKQTGKQVIRFGGNIANTGFGKDLFEADVILKKLGLGLIPTHIPTVPSYFDLSARQAKLKKADENISTRFWFYPLSPSLAKRQGVFVIKELKVGVITQVMSAIVKGKPVKDLSKVKDTVASKFAAGLTENYALITGHYPEIAKLKVLFDLVGLAEGIRSLKTKPNMEFWLWQYQLPQVVTPVDYPLLKREERLEIPGKIRIMEIDGGIELKALISSLQDGDVNAFKEIVLKSRPDSETLVWQVPLEGWSIPGGLAIPQNTGGTSKKSPITPHPLSKKIGCTLEKQVRPLGVPSRSPNPNFSGINYPPPNFQMHDRLPPKGGVQIDSKFIKKGTGGKEERDRTLTDRPSSKSRSWTVTSPKSKEKP